MKINALITRLIVINIAPLTLLFFIIARCFVIAHSLICNLSLLKDITLRSRTNAPSPAYFFEKESPPPPPLLLIFGFSSLAPKKFEEYKTYLSILNSIDFFECFRFQCYF